jgi:hypothetical protein
VRAQRLNHFATKAFYSKMVKTLLSHKNKFGDRGHHMTPAWDAQHLLVPEMRPVDL